MADIIKFGQSMLGVAKTCAANQDRGDVSAFFVLQHNTVQNAAAEARRSGASAPPAGHAQGGQAGGPPKGDAPGSAMARLQAMLKQNK